MKREEELLRQACAEIAQEEADQLERGLTPSDIRQAEQAYRRHRKKALSLIRRSAKTTRPIRVYLSAAAAAAVIFAAVYVSLNHSAPDPVTVSQPPTASVAPYYSPVPTAEPSPAPTSIPPTESPVFTDIPTTSPTKTPNSATTELVSPTFGEAPEVTPTQTPVPAWTPSPAPTQTPAPTATPEPAPTAQAPEDALPEGWTGSYFPALWLSGAHFSQQNAGDGWRSVVCEFEEGQWEFTEYDTAEMVAVPQNAAVSYVQWNDIVALRTEDAEGVTLAWTQEGRSFSLRCTAGDGEDIAKSVKKIPAQ